MKNSLEFVGKCLLPGDLNHLFTIIQDEKRQALGDKGAEGFALGAAIGFSYYDREDEMRDTDRFILKYSPITNAGKEYGELLADEIQSVSPHRLWDLQNTLMSSILFGLASAD